MFFFYCHMVFLQVFTYRKLTFIIEYDDFDISDKLVFHIRYEIYKIYRCFRFILD